MRKVIGGLIGVEAALNVANHGGKPFTIEKMSQIAQTAYPVNRQHLEVLLRKKQIPVYLNANITKVENGSIYFTYCDEDAKLEFEQIAECVGMKSNTVNSRDDNIITIGDAERIDNVLNAVWSAFRKCRLI